MGDAGILGPKRWRREIRVRCLKRLYHQETGAHTGQDEATYSKGILARRPPSLRGDQSCRKKIPSHI